MQALMDLCVHALAVDQSCVPRGQQLSTAFGGEEALGRRGGSGDTPEMYGSRREQRRCFLSFNLHVVTTISGSLCCLYRVFRWFGRDVELVLHDLSGGGEGECR